MPFIDRDETGKIKGIYSPKQYKGQEWIENDSQELIDHLAKQAADREKIQSTESLIQAKIRELAIMALIAEGKLTAEGKLVE